MSDVTTPMTPRNGELPLSAAMSHAAGMSPFSGDGAVMHRLRDEIERMRWFLAHRAMAPTFLTELDVYTMAQQRELEIQQGFRSGVVPGSDT